MDYFLLDFKIFLVKLSFKRFFLFILLIISLLIFKEGVNHKNINFHELSKQNLEIKRSMDWINKQQFDEIHHVVGYNMFPYFNKNQQVVYLGNFFGCDSVMCVLNKEGITKNVIVIKNRDSQFLNSFKIKEMSALVFNNAIEESCLTLVHRVFIKTNYDFVGDHWSHIYYFDYEMCNKLDLTGHY